MDNKCTKFFFLAFTAAMLSLPVYGQRLVANSLNGSMTPAAVNKRLPKVFSEKNIPEISRAIDLQKITYVSTNENGKRVNLTGLVAMPRGGAPKGLVVFMHGTIFDRRNSPSRFKGKDDGSEAETAILAFATDGYAVALPDYIGLGDDMHFHPYPLNITNAVAGFDIINASRSLATKLRYAVAEPLFVTGYSEGGGTAMALVKMLQESNGKNHKVVRSAPASGPYDLSGVTRDFIFEPTKTEGFGIRLYLLSYSVYYFHKERGIKLTDYFKPLMAKAIADNYKRTLTDKSLITRLVLTSALMQPKSDIKNVLTDRFVKALETLDRRDPLIAELMKNNVFDWSPREPMLLINVEGDGVVDPKNSAKAFDTMRNRSVGREILRRSIITGTDLNHLTAVPEAMYRARTFFNDGFANIRE